MGWRRVAGAEGEVAKGMEGVGGVGGGNEVFYDGGGGRDAP